MALLAFALSFDEIIVTTFTAGVSAAEIERELASGAGMESPVVALSRSSPRRA